MRTAGTDLASAAWRKSGYSSGGEHCVEVADDFPGAVPVRDSKNSSGSTLVIPAAAWGEFVAAVRIDGLIP
ncbi:DUF397 domain-containing protein [Streptomyces gamaensis]|uniref:DUF397 domain-containing protein n=1 Tax=Streptomyces gamaensis TaxID=1763542 RepID=A0ABW0Z1V8_9ACTN